MSAKFLRPRALAAQGWPWLAPLPPRRQLLISSDSSFGAPKSSRQPYYCVIGRCKVDYRSAGHLIALQQLHFESVYNNIIICDC
ncbi:hypothetical protein E2562_035096 [Oryza meyeriana var. granulata]|uniref:Uncharacterized protein n=1 Tax=Oryza meyeriana var. granulata TaxID=110450 RepID=A0A6G1FFR9_9ORYZ|nr:hypothetical protein E2562_035096 [Oryza meyeriana var. granulata]